MKFNSFLLKQTAVDITTDTNGVLEQQVALQTFYRLFMKYRLCFNIISLPKITSANTATHSYLNQLYGKQPIWHYKNTDTIN